MTDTITSEILIDEPATEEKTENNGLDRKGVLNIVSTPIGNWDDMTLRAIKVLKKSDKVICEEGKAGARVLKQYNINKEIVLLNEQNESEIAEELVMDIAAGMQLSLISDCGTPVFADPGYQLVKAALRRNLEIVVVPGASSIMTAIVRSGFPINEFLYAGFLDRNKEDRIRQLKEFSKERRTTIILETPYRIMPFLEAAKDIIPFRNCYIGCNLTLPFETHHYGTFSELYERFKDLKFKGEFIIVFEGLPNDKQDYDVNASYTEKDEGRMEKGEWRKDDRRDRPSSDRRDDRRGMPSGDRRDDRRGRPSFERSDDRRGRPSGDRRDDRRGRPSGDRRDDRRERPSFERSDERRGRPSGDRRDDRRERPSFERSDNRRVRPSSDRHDDRREKLSGDRSDDRRGRPSGDRSDDRRGRPYGNRSDDRRGRPSGDRSDDRGDRPSHIRSDRDKDSKSSGKRTYKDRKPRR